MIGCLPACCCARTAQDRRDPARRRVADRPCRQTGPARSDSGRRRQVPRRTGQRVAGRRIARLEAGHARTAPVGARRGRPVETLTDSFSERTGVPVDCSIDYPQRHPFDATLYGVARELLTNVSRHANAHRVALDLFDEGDDVTLNVRDDGVGMDPAVLSRRLSEGHIGLASHRARIETLGGTVEFRPVTHGTWVAVRLPIRVGQEAP